MANENPSFFESEIQAFWEKNQPFTVKNSSKKPKKYILDMFPYPSGDGLHVGHVEGYTASDIVSRYNRMRGFDVLHPMGWDSFGLPAENYAMKVNIHPRLTTDKNTKNFKRQMQSLGFSYDWDREIDTSSEEFYKWSQWFFLLFYKLGLAYRKEAAVNWCDVCQTVLANEQVVNGMCERTKNPVTQKLMPQWFFKVTEYAERLLNDLDPLEWPESLKQMQRNWIGRSEGAYLTFVIDGGESIKVFTTRPDTLYGVTYVVLAPEHPLVSKITAKSHTKEVAAYVEATKHRSDLDRTGFNQEKTGVWTGAYAIHPLTKQQIPVWIGDFVLSTYGTGAVMSVPAHDERDFAFAKKYGLPIKQVVVPANGSAAPTDAPYTAEGILLDSDMFTAMPSEKARKEIVKAAEGEHAITYKIRDWLISRQRFWGAPIPIVYCDTCGMQPVSEDQLPVVLPKEADFSLKGDGKSPLARVESFVNTTCPKCGDAAKRETDTMDGFVDNSWYFFRFCDPKNNKAFAEKKALKRWMPIDLYIGGAEHAVGHLIYSRFYTKVLHDQGYIDFTEPFTKLVNQGLILAEDGQKMSKSLGNVINPDDVVKLYGADCLRMYEMFLGPIHEAKPWDTKGILGMRRFLDRVYRFYTNGGVTANASADPELTAALHRTVKKVTDDIEALHFNTAISAMMVFMNAAQDKKSMPVVEAEAFLKLLSPFAPHMAEHLWLELGHKQSISAEAWPVADESLLKMETITMGVQVNGKSRGTIDVAADADEATTKAAALANETVAKHLADKPIKKVIFVRGRIINFIV